MSDMVMLWGGGQPEWRVNHGAGWASTKNASRAQFDAPKLDGANELFGDAHVEWKNPNHFRELIEAPKGPLGWLNATQNSTFERGIDHYWW